MADLSTTYLGLKLKNPILVASSGLAKDAAGVKKCADAGAGAVVLKSIFEEQFLVEQKAQENDYFIHPEAMDYLRSGGLLEYAPEKICREIEAAKKESDIPIIASINCQTKSLWPSFARQVEEAGADALELNIYNLPIDIDTPGSAVDDDHVEILKQVKDQVNIPVSIKLTPEVSSLPYLAGRLANFGADGLVLFNWFLAPDINLKKMTSFAMKSQGDFNQSLRWVALIAGRINADIAASGGVKDAAGIIKQLLAGANVVQICTLFYQQGLAEISGLIEEMNDWMDHQQFSTIAALRGNLSFREQELSFKDLGEAAGFFRAQYLKTFK